MNLTQTNELTKEQTDKITKLESLCYEKDKLENHLFLSNEINFDRNIPVFFFAYDADELIGFLTVFIPTREEAEISAIVHPAHVQKGIFTALDLAARKIIAENGIKRILYCVETKSISATEVLKHWNISEIERSEYRMSQFRPCVSTDESVQAQKERFCAKRIDKDNAEAYKAISDKVYGDDDRDYVETLIASTTRLGYIFYKDDLPVGIFAVGLETENEPCIYGVAIDEAQRGKGYGKLMMKKACEIGFKYGNTLQLDVDSDNPVAFHLYQSLGFQITFQVDYYKR